LKQDLEKLKQARRKKGLTLRDLAAKVGVSRQALSSYERGDYPPSEEIWKKLKEILNLPGMPKDYWGRLAQGGRIRKYNKGDTCFIEGCDLLPVSKGLCRRHYNQLRNRLMAKKKD
jgi:DNA-binding XRE family transcriptional regulator